MNNGVVSYICGRRDWGFSFSVVEGGILFANGKRMFEAIDCVSEQRFIAMKGRWLDNVEAGGMICMYVPMDCSERKSFFEYLSRLVL